MKGRINPLTVEIGELLQVVDKDSKYFGHAGQVKKIYHDRVTLELDIDANGHLIAFGWEQVERP